MKHVSCIFTLKTEGTFWPAQYLKGDSEETNIPLACLHRPGKVRPDSGPDERGPKLKDVWTVSEAKYTRSTRRHQ